MSKERSPEQFNEYVQNLERDWGLAKIEESHQAHKAAEGCGCSQCVKWYNRTQQEMEDEANRLYYPPEIDHEEQWVQDRESLDDTFSKLDKEGLKKRGLI